MTANPIDLKNKIDDVSLKLEIYRMSPNADSFVEFSVYLSSFSDFLKNRDLGGLHKAASLIEQRALSLFDEAGEKPLTNEIIDSLQIEINSLVEKIREFIERSKRVNVLIDRRVKQASASSNYPTPTHKVWFVGEDQNQWSMLAMQLNYFGIKAEIHSLSSIKTETDEAKILIIDTDKMTSFEACENIKNLHERFSTCKFIAQNFPSDFKSIKEALRSGCDFCFPTNTPQSTILSKIIDLSNEEDVSPFRVLVVEDSITASKAIQQTLTKNDIRSFAVTNPEEILNGLRSFQPDLILMDMYMPDCTGVEATRVIRQHPEFLSTPIVYLSGDSDMALQVAALRLGGENFLTKPFNPVFLSTVVKSKIERYRALRRSMFYDGLTGLLNHQAIKEKLNQSIDQAKVKKENLVIAMIDIDHFKKVNDTYGHPSGDQVIRSLAWMLKNRLRKTDMVGRYGGEEFMVIMPGSDAKQAFEVLDRIRKDFCQIKYQFKDVFFEAKFSGGIAQFQKSKSPEKLTKEADEALYESKKNGRNCITI